VADRNRAQRSATVSGGRNNPQQFETDCNRRQQQGESQAAKNLVVEHKGRDARVVFLWVYLFVPPVFPAGCISLQTHPAWDAALKGTSEPEFC